MIGQAWYGCIPDLPDQRDRKFMFSPAQALMPTSALPASVDLREWLPPVMDQGSLGSCTAHGVTAALRYNWINNDQPDIPLSRLALYYDSRMLEGSVASDSGAQIRDVIKVAAKGVAREALWPYDLTKWSERPPQEAYKDAPLHEAIEYRRVDVSARAIKTALFTGRPVIVGVTLYASFESDSVAATGVVPMPAKHEHVVGGHCLLVWGYGQRPGFFSVRNSWGESWGHKGDCFFPEAYLSSPDYASDLWVISSTSDLPA